MESVNIPEALLQDSVLQWLRAGFIVVVGLLLARILSRSLYRLTHGVMGEDGAITLRRFSFYLLLIVVAMAAMREMTALRWRETPGRTTAAPPRSDRFRRG